MVRVDLSYKHTTLHSDKWYVHLYFELPREYNFDGKPIKCTYKFGEIHTLVVLDE